jgi:uncharacterized protein (DUF433 family)
MPTTAELKPTGFPHIYLDAQGRGWIDDTNIKVVEVVYDAIGVNRLTPERIHEEHPHLSMAQIHAALTYYYDNKAEMDAYMTKEYEEYLQIRAQTENPELQARLRAARDERLTGT